VLMAKPIGYSITDQLITWCASPVLGGRTAHGFELIVGDDNLVLNRASGATLNVSQYIQIYPISNALMHAPFIYLLFSHPATLQTKIFQLLPSKTGGEFQIFSSR
jgi:hypothetical protein